jgi:tetratricopeptide (TPR) repeat protein
MRILGILMLLALSACAPKARGPSPQTLAELAKADSLLRDGCYACLKDALAIYERQKHAQGAFDAALLIAVREKELGIPTLRLASLIPAGSATLAQGGDREKTLVAATDLIIGETSGLDPVQRAALTGRDRPPVDKDNPTRRALDPLFGKDLVATYVALAIDCESPRLIESVDAKALMTTYENVPLMRFRIARCGRPAMAAPLTALRAADSRWTDTLFWEGRHALTGSPALVVDLSKVIQLYGEGRTAFPESLALDIAWANTNMSAEEFEPALSGFDHVLATFPEHRDALSGRMQSLSYLMRHPDAIATATRILDLGTWHIGDAYYWRAWNRYHLKEYDAAWADVENALKGVSNSGVYMLAGLIAYARTELPTAVQRFDRAFEINPSACDAVWMSGLVSIDLTELAVAAPKFTRAMTCFVSAAAALRGDLKQRQEGIAKRGTPATPREERIQTRLQRDIDNAEEKSAQAAYNGAQCYARTGDRGLAINLIDVAIGHPRMKEKAEAVKAAIEKLPK